MLASLIIVFREAMEAGLVVGVVLAATKGVAHRARWIAGGIGGGATGAALMAAFTGALSNALEGTGQEAFTATILIFAVAMLTWHIVWMSGHGRAIAAELRQVGEAVRMGQRTLLALAVVVGVAVLREGIEVVLFLFGILAATQEGALSLALGAITGLALACTLSWLLYRGLVAIPMRHLFTVTNALIALLAAGMAGQAAAVLHSVDLLPAWGEQLWNTSFLIPDDGLLGRSLHALVGYSARPSGIQLAAWLATLATLAVLSGVVGRPRVKQIAVAMLGLLLLGGGAAGAQNLPTVEFRQHRFVPDRIEVPAHQKFQLQVKNSDTTADEFESTELNREKLVPSGQAVTIFLGPLEPGEYHFFGDFHQDTARGVLVAK